MMKKLTMLFLLAGALFLSLSPAFAYTSATPALPDQSLVEPYGVFSDLWFVGGISRGD